MDSQLIIIIGLPKSGKTTFSKQLNQYLIFDDFITKYYNGNVESALKSKQKVCLIDPRLCIPDIFLQYITEIENYIDRKNILLILFENDPTNCLKNASKYPTLHNTIINYTQKYDLTNYQQWRYVIKPVYSGN